MSDCIEWHKGLFTNGYGQRWDPSTKRSRFAHRMAWEEANGRPVPEGMFVCHKCDNPKCVNPDHLFIGTHQDNMDDMKRKGRGSKRHGEDVNTTKLKVSDVVLIKGMLERHKNCGRFLSDWFGVSKMTVSDINTGKTWRRVDGLQNTRG